MVSKNSAPDTPPPSHEKGARPHKEPDRKSANPVAYKIEFQSLPWEHPKKGVRCKTFRQGNTQIRLAEYVKDMPMHICEKGHIGMVLIGRLEIQFEGSSEVFEPGDGIYIPDGAEHWHMGRPLTDVVRLILVENAL